MFTTEEALNRLLDNNELFYDEMTDLMRQIMSGQVAPELIAAILIGLRVKVETISEITAAANVMREFATKVNVQNADNLIDIVGTGGDGQKTFNISSTALFVAAGMGVQVAKHGGRSVSSTSGAADVMECMGVVVDLDASAVAQCIENIGIGFMYAPNYHPAMKYVAPVRKALKVRTVFNILGPLTNPASAPNQVLGVFHPDLVGICSQVCKGMGSQRVLVVNGKDGLDEFTIMDNSLVAELKDGVIYNYEVIPEDCGLSRYTDSSGLKVASSQESLSKLNAVLSGEQGICRDIVLLNAGAMIYCANLASSIKEGVEMAIESIDSGKAKRKQQEFIDYTQQLRR